MGLLELIDDVNLIKDLKGMFLLHQTYRLDWSIWGGVFKSLVEKCKLDVKIVDENGDTPLHLASQFNNVGAVHYLLTLRSCDLSMKNKSGFSPLDIAREKGNNDVVEVLIEASKLGELFLVVGIKSCHGYTC